MEHTKPWYQSRTIWGALIAIAASAGGFFGLSINAADQNILTDAALQITGVIGALIALYGRLSANRKIK